MNKKGSGLMIYTDKERKNDFHWFVKNYDLLYKQYGHKFIVIQNQIVLGVYDGMREALDETSKNHSLGTFSVQECNGDESAYTASIVTVGLVV